MAIDPQPCREERLKHERNPLELRADLDAFEAQGQGTVTKDDAFRLKWHLSSPLQWGEAGGSHSRQ